jgi:hypothetical protein
MQRPGCGNWPVAYDVAGTNWKLSVASNGIGKPAGVFAQAKVGLGTSIVHQLDARVKVLSGPQWGDRVGSSRDFCKDAPGHVEGGGPDGAVSSRACLDRVESYGFRRKR